MTVTHPLGPRVAQLCRQYPSQSLAIFQTFLDLSLAQAWQDLQVVELTSTTNDDTSAVVFSGHKSSSPTTTEYVVPIPLQQPLSMQHLSNIFKTLDSQRSIQQNKTDSTTPTTTNVEQLLLAIVDKDSSVVYYVLKRGIVSPKEVRD
ncbi:hypothetical protein OIO90_003213 [Microbotryomycetes sp. JL221]|nr:hypothetical protein OIO90_003213 [Microbotryomycetes sp. JL221]